jgi:hypothetical protein
VGKNSGVSFTGLTLMYQQVVFFSSGVRRESFSLLIHGAGGIHLLIDVEPKSLLSQQL